VRRLVSLLIPTLLIVAAMFLTTGPASAAAPGFDVNITDLPRGFSPGAEPSTVTVVVSTDAGKCQKVRWSMVVRVSGLQLNDVRVDRVEEDGSFPFTVQAAGNSARLTDERPDPGTLCPGRTVTATYRVAVDDDAADGEITLVPEAHDSDNQLLQLASATRRVSTDANVDQSPSEEGSAEASEEPSADPSEPADQAGQDPGLGAGPTLPASGPGGDSSLLILGVTIGAILIFLGVGLLLRLRMRGRSADRAIRPEPVGPTL
jgi:hypothetical protein